MNTENTPMHQWLVANIASELITGCIPFYFKPVAIDSMGNEVSIKRTLSNYELYVDGGMLCNFPINMFDSCSNGANPLTNGNVKFNYQTLGLKLEREKQVQEFEENKTVIAPYHVKNMKDYTSAVMNLMMEKLSRNNADLRNEKKRTIYISYGEFSGRPRKISLEEKKVLHDNGAAAADQFFNSNTAIQ